MPVSGSHAAPNQLAPPAMPGISMVGFSRDSGVKEWPVVVFLQHRFRDQQMTASGPAEVLQVELLQDRDLVCKIPNGSPTRCDGSRSHRLHTGAACAGIGCSPAINDQAEKSR